MEDTYGIQSRIGSIIVVERWYCCRGSPVFSDRNIQSATSMPIDYEKMQNYDTVESEVADVFIVLLSLCNVLKIDIYEAFIAKEKENTERAWNP